MYDTATELNAEREMLTTCIFLRASPFRFRRILDSAHAAQPKVDQDLS